MLLQKMSIVILMVIDCVRKRNQDGGDANRREFGYSQRARSSDDQVRPFVHVAHVIDKSENLGLDI